MLNASYLIGKITSTPTITRPAPTKTIAKFAVVTHREYSNQSGELKTEFCEIPVLAFGRVAIQVGEKGKLDALVLIKGRLSRDGTSLAVTAEHINFGLSELEASSLSKPLQLSE